MRTAEKIKTGWMNTQLAGIGEGMENRSATTPFMTVERMAWGSLGIGVLVLALKYCAYLLTGSVALYSDAMESIVNVAAAVAALVAVRVAMKPADAEHPYGHHKAEYCAAVLEGVLIILAAGWIVFEAYQAFVAPRAVEIGWQGVTLNALATALNGLWGFWLIREGRKRKSMALAADGRHLMADVVSSGGVLVGILLAVATGWMLLDPLLAVLVAANIVWSGWVLITESFSGLMDEAVEPATLQEIERVIAAHATGAIEAHDLRTRHAGRVTFIDFHLVVPGAWTVREGHELCDRLEDALEAAVPDAVVVIHVEPEEKAEEGLRIRGFEG